jgi:arginase
MLKPKTVALIGAPFCEGQNLEGADLAPAAMREAGLPEAVKTLGLGWQDVGDIDFSSVTNGSSNSRYSLQRYREWLSAGTSSVFSTWIQTQSPMAESRNQDAYPVTKPDITDEGAPQNKLNIVNVDVMGAGLKLVHDKVKEVLSSSTTPSPVSSPPFVLTVGGDHSIASGSISAVLERYPNCGVIWVDAHADANTPRSSPSGHYHGMPAAHLLGWFNKPGELGEGVQPGDLRGFEWCKGGCLPENKLVYIGLRDVDAEEGRMLRASGVSPSAT